MMLMLRLQQIFMNFICLIRQVKSSHIYLKQLYRDNRKIMHKSLFPEETVTVQLKFSDFSEV